MESGITTWILRNHPRGNERRRAKLRGPPLAHEARKRSGREILRARPGSGDGVSRRGLQEEHQYGGRSEAAETTQPETEQEELAHSKSARATKAGVVDYLLS